MKLKKNLLIIIPCCIFVVALIVILLLFFTGFFLSPKSRVMLALSNTFGVNSFFSEYSGNDNVSEYGYAPEYVEDVLNAASAIASIMEDGNTYEAGITLKELDLPGSQNSRLLAGLGLDLAGESDPGKRLAHHTLNLRYNFLNLSVGELYFDEDSLSLAIPECFEGYITVPTDTFGSSYNASALPSITGYEIPKEQEDDLCFSPFDLYDPSRPSADSFSDIEENIAILQNFYDEITVEKTEETRSILIGGKEQTCDEYLITISEESVTDLLDSYEEWYTSYDKELPEENRGYLRTLFAVDHEIYVYLDRSNRLIAASYENELNASGGSDKPCTVYSEITFHGEDYLPENYDGAIRLSYTAEDDVQRLLEINFEGENTLNTEEEESGNAEQTSSLDAEIMISDMLDEAEGLSEEKSYDFSLDISYRLDDGNLMLQMILASDSAGLEIDSECNTEITGETIACNFEDFSVNYTAPDSRAASISLTADFSFSVLSEDVATPAGTRYDLFSMSKSELYDFLGNLLKNWGSGVSEDLLDIVL